MFDCKTGERVTGELTVWERTQYAGAESLAPGTGAQKRQQAAALQGARPGRRPLQKQGVRTKRYLAVMAEAPTTIYSYFFPLTLNFILSLSSVN